MDKNIDILKEVVNAPLLTEDDLIDIPVSKKDRKTLFNELIELGKSKGKLTTQEIMDAMEDFDFDPEQVDKLYETLESNNIEIIDDLEVSLGDIDLSIDEILLRKVKFTS